MLVDKGTPELILVFRVVTTIGELLFGVLKTLVEAEGAALELTVLLRLEATFDVELGRNVLAWENATLDLVLVSEVGATLGPELVLGIAEELPFVLEAKATLEPELAFIVPETPLEAEAALELVLVLEFWTTLLSRLVLDVMEVLPEVGLLLEIAFALEIEAGELAMAILETAEEAILDNADETALGIAAALEVLDPTASLLLTATFENELVLDVPKAIEEITLGFGVALDEPALAVLLDITE